MNQSMHWSIYSVVVGTIMFVYMNSFLKNMNLYKKTDYTMTWGQFVDATISNEHRESTI
jgi:hypothetical protein